MPLLGGHSHPVIPLPIHLLSVHPADIASTTDRLVEENVDLI